MGGTHVAVRPQSASLVHTVPLMGSLGSLGLLHFWRRMHVPARPLQSASLLQSAPSTGSVGSAECVAQCRTRPAGPHAVVPASCVNLRLVGTLPATCGHAVSHLHAAQTWPAPQPLGVALSSQASWPVTAPSPQTLLSMMHVQEEWSQIVPPAQPGLAAAGSHSSLGEMMPSPQTTSLQPEVAGRSHLRVSLSTSVFGLPSDLALRVYVFLPAFAPFFLSGTVTSTKAPQAELVPVTASPASCGLTVTFVMVFGTVHPAICCRM